MIKYIFLNFAANLAMASHWEYFLELYSSKYLVIMKKNVKLVLNVLKPKVKALGFSRDELEGIAADVADNLELDDDASDDDINAEIEKHVNAVVPYLKIAQKTAQRTIQKFKDSTVDNDDEPDGEPDGGIRKNHSNKHDEPEKIPGWGQALLTQQKSILTELASMKDNNISNIRRQKLKSLLKDTGTFGKSTLKSFDLMKFDDEAAFDEFYDGVVEDLAAINQERANEGLGKLGAPAVNRQPKKDNDVEVISDADVDALAETM